MFTNIGQLLYFCLRSLRYVEAGAPFTPWETGCRPQHKNGCGLSFGFPDSMVWEHAGLQTLLSIFVIVNQTLVVLVLPARLQWVQSPPCFIVCSPSLPSAPTTFPAPGHRFQLAWWAWGVWPSALGYTPPCYPQPSALPWGRLWCW